MKSLTAELRDVRFEAPSEILESRKSLSIDDYSGLARFTVVGHPRKGDDMDEGLKSDLRVFLENDIHIPTRTIYIGQGGISLSDDNDSIGGYQAAMVTKGIHILESINDDPITVLINTPGGDIYQGLAIYDVLTGSTCHITTIAVGHCMSMGTIVLQGGDTRKSYPNTSFLIHEGYAGGQNSISKFIAEAEEVKRLYEKLVDIYKKNLKTTKANVKKLVSVESYLDAQQALNLGLIDEIVG